MIALKRDRMGRFPLRSLFDEFFSSVDDLKAASQDPSASESRRDLSVSTLEASKSLVVDRPGLGFEDADGQLGMLKKEAEQIHLVQNAMVLLYAVINPDSAENKQETASADKVLAAMALLSAKCKKKKKGTKAGARKFKKLLGKSRHGGEEVPEIFNCHRGCGFKGDFDTVGEHETG
jgi:hypothetical protein